MKFKKLKFCFVLLIALNLICFCLVLDVFGADGSNTKIKDDSGNNTKVLHQNEEIDPRLIKMIEGKEKSDQQAQKEKALTEKQQFEALQKDAKKGDVEAQFKLGELYEQGSDTIHPSLVEAGRWYEKAAAKGHTLSRNKLAVLYYHGLGKYKKDPVKAMGLFEKSASENNSNAMFMLGRIYMEGAEGIQRDLKKGTDLIQSAALAGNEYAMDDLGVMYYTGTQFISRDRGQAYLWYLRAATKGYTPAMVHIGSMYYFGIEPVPKDEKKGIGWVEGAYKNGDEAAYAILVEWGGGQETERTIELELKKGNNLLSDPDAKTPPPKAE